MSFVKYIASYLPSYSGHLRVKDGGVAESVVGEDVSPVVDLLQSQVYHRDGSWSGKTSCHCGDVGEAEWNFLSITITQAQQNNCKEL